MSREHYQHLASLDDVVARNQYDAVSLLETLEDLKIFEADRDLNGIDDTVDLLGCVQLL